MKREKTRTEETSNKWLRLRPEPEFSKEHISDAFRQPVSDVASRLQLVHSELLDEGILSGKLDAARSVILLPSEIGKFSTLEWVVGVATEPSIVEEVETTRILQTVENIKEDESD